MKPKKIYIIILNYKSWKDAIECINSVINSDYEEYQIILIDNNSPNRSEEKIQQWFDADYELRIESPYFKSKLGSSLKQPLPYVAYISNHTLHRDIRHEDEIYSKHINKYSKSIIKYPIVFVQTEKNLGFAGGNNVVLRNLINSEENAGILLLNPDTFIDSGALTALVNCATSSKNFLMGLSIRDYSNPEVLLSIGGYAIIKPFGVIQSIKNYNDVSKIDYIYGGALYTDTTTLYKIGVMPEDYFLYWEETDWCYGAKRTGVDLVVCKEAVCYDKIGGSVGRGYLSEYFFTYNSLLFYSKHFRLHMITLVPFHLFRLIIKLFKMQLLRSNAIIRAVMDFFLGKRHIVE